MTDSLQSTEPAPERIPATNGMLRTRTASGEVDEPDAVSIMLPDPYSFPREGLDMAIASEACLTAMKQLYGVHQLYWRWSEVDIRKRVDLHGIHEGFCRGTRESRDGSDTSLLKSYLRRDEREWVRTNIGEEDIQAALFLERLFAETRDGRVVRGVGFQCRDLDVGIGHFDGILECGKVGGIKINEIQMLGAFVGVDQGRSASRVPVSCEKRSRHTCIPDALQRADPSDNADLVLKLHTAGRFAELRADLLDSRSCLLGEVLHVGSLGSGRVVAGCHGGRLSSNCL